MCGHTVVHFIPLNPFNFHGIWSDLDPSFISVFSVILNCGTCRTLRILIGKVLVNHQQGNSAWFPENPDNGALLAPLHVCKFPYAMF